MGLSNSKDPGMRRIPSSSAAFGRLRIDSPGATTPGSTMSIRRRHQQRMMAESGASPMIGSGYQYSSIATEQASLIPPRQMMKESPTNDLLVAGGSPPLAVWIAPALCCAMAYALYNIFIKKGSSHINPVMGGVILQLVAAVLGCCLLGFLVWKEGGAQIIDYDREGIQWAVCAGIAVGTAEIISFFVSSLGVQAMQSIPIIIGGSVLFGTVMGALALHEELSSRGWLGVLLISIGISLVGLDTSDGDDA